MEHAPEQSRRSSRRNRPLAPAGPKDNRDMQQRIFRLSSYSVRWRAGALTSPRSDATINPNPIQYRSSKADLQAGCVAMLLTVGSQASALSGDQEAEVRWVQWM